MHVFRNRSYDINPCIFSYIQFSSIQFRDSVVSYSLWPHGLQHARPPGPSPTPGAYSNSCPLSLWCHPTISSSVIPFSSCLQSFSGSGSFSVSQFFPSGGQSVGVSPSASDAETDAETESWNNIQDRFLVGWTGLISLQSKGLSRVFSSTTFQYYVKWLGKFENKTKTKQHSPGKKATRKE